MPFSKFLLSTALTSFASTALAFPAEFEFSTLNGKNGFQITGEARADYNGSSVASAGDVNGDGFDDVIIGAFHADPRGRDSGASYVVFGKAGGFAADLNLSRLDGRNGFQINGEQADDYSGRVVAGAGDVNGDGFDDVIIGADRANPNDANPNQFRAGASYVVFGKAGRFAPNLNLASLTGATGFKISGEAFFDGSGISVASAGDVNGDGFGDVIIGAQYAEPNGAQSGSTYVVFGKDRFTANLNLSALNGANGFQLNGEGFRDLSGASVASAGDVNGDGFDDVVIGAGSVGGRNDFAGASYVLFGRAGRFPATVELSSLNGRTGIQINGEAPGDLSGEVASAGDVNGDGFDDLIIGAPGVSDTAYNAGASYIVFGARRLANFNLSRLNGANGFQLNGERAYDSSGASVASAGDVNGDGFDDVTIGANYADGGGPQSGSSYLVFGKAGGFPANLALAKLNGRNGFQLNGEAPNDYSGGSVASAGDVNGDGFSDIIVGAPLAEPNATGASYVVFGKSTGRINRSGTAADEVFVGGPSNDRFNGAGGDDRLIGKGGDDDLRGGAGVDRLEGGPGNDRLEGGPDKDILIGGKGRDLYCFPHPTYSRRGAARDRITNFEQGEDRIDLSAIDADGGGGNGNQAFAFRGRDGFSGARGELRFTPGNNLWPNTLVAGDIDGDRVADFEIVIDGRVILTARDFLR